MFFCGSLGKRELHKKQKSSFRISQFIKTLILKKPYFQTWLKKLTNVLKIFVIGSVLLVKNLIISVKIFKKITNLDKLYLLSKIHKCLYNIPGRSVISNGSTPTEKASEFNALVVGFMFSILVIL